MQLVNIHKTCFLKILTLLVSTALRLIHEFDQTAEYKTEASTVEVVVSKTVACDVNGLLCKQRAEKCDQSIDTFLLAEQNFLHVKLSHITAQQLISHKYLSSYRFFLCFFADRTILVWYLKDLSNAKDRKTFRVNVEYDHVFKLCWSPDSKAILGFTAMEETIEAYRLEKKDGIFTSYAKSVTFPRAHESDDIISLEISCNGKFIMSATNKTEIILWDVRGNILERLDSFLMTNYSVKISPCGRFIAASGFAPDVKMWEVKFNKTGNYEKTVRAFELTGHNSGVWDFAFDHDASHLATVCKDGTFKLFDVKSINRFCEIYRANSFLFRSRLRSRRICKMPLDRPL